MQINCAVSSVSVFKSLAATDIVKPLVIFCCSELNLYTNTYTYALEWMRRVYEADVKRWGLKYTSKQQQQQELHTLMTFMIFI